MEGIYEELYTFLLSQNVEECKIHCFKEWLKWYIDNDLYHIERDADGNLVKAVFLRRLNSNDIQEFPEYLHAEIVNIDLVTKFYLHRPEGNVFYCELLADKNQNVKDLKIENLNFAFSWAINKFNVQSIDPSQILLYYKKGDKVNINLKDIEDVVSRYRG